MSEGLPLIVPETNILMDIWLGRDDSVLNLFLPLAEQDEISLVVPELVLKEFRGTALDWIERRRQSVDGLRATANQWTNTTPLGDAGDELYETLGGVDESLAELRDEVEDVLERFRSAADVFPHSPEIHTAGDLRWVAGEPPDQPREGLEDCRIFEAVLAIGREDASTGRPMKVFATKDDDFDDKLLDEQLGDVDMIRRADIGALFGELYED